MSLPPTLSTPIEPLSPRLGRRLSGIVHRGQPWAAEVRLLGVARPVIGWMALAAALGVLTVISGVALMAASAYVISAAALRPSIAELQVAIVALRLFGISRGLLRYAERLASHHATFALLARLRLWFFVSLEPLAPARLLGFRSGDLLARILSDIEMLQEFFLRAVAPPVVALLVALLTALVLCGLSPALAALNLILACLGGIGLAWLAQRLTRSNAARLVDARSRMQATVVEALQGIEDWLVYGLEAEWGSQVAALGTELAHTQTRRSRTLALVSAASTCLGVLACLATLALLTPLVRQGSLNGVFLASVALGVLASYEPVGALPAAAEQSATSRQAAARLIEIVEAEPEIDEGPGGLLDAPFRSLRVEHLSFHYPGDARPVLSDVSFDLVPGRRLAILGASGSGKSTLAHLLLRFWEVDAGCIQVNEQDVRRLQPAAIRQLFSSLLQPPYLFSATVGENIRLQQPGVSSAEIELALELAGLKERVDALPDGLEAWVGEYGTALSAGERQRLALARALARPAPILLLDEPTAGLDPVTAGRVLDNLWRALGERALILITHDPTGLDQVDEILVME
ncbi:MAG: thiol reductant ABC exporter subunit CydC, partial [Anaerolineales bacterium]|nr:thiol reductant ABC exporter subunit CydC [Anaerolineales bacterium]